MDKQKVINMPKTSTDCMSEFFILILLVYFSVVSISCFCKDFWLRKKSGESQGWVRVSGSGWGEGFFFCRLTDSPKFRDKLSLGVSCWQCCPSRAGIRGCWGHLSAHRRLSVSREPGLGWPVMLKAGTRALCLPVSGTKDRGLLFTLD